MKSHTTKTKKAKIIFEGKSNSKRKLLIPIISVALLIMAIVIVGLLSNWSFYLSSSHSSDVVLDETVLVFVNDVPIKQFQLDTQWDSIPVEYKTNLTRDVVLSEMVKEELLLQDAKNKNVSVNESDVDNFILSQLAQAGMDLDSYKASLIAQGTDYDTVKGMYMRQLTISSLLEKETNPGDLVVSEDDVVSYYDNHTSDFFQDEKVVVRHILTPITNNTNESSAKEFSESLLDQIKTNESIFCDLVKNFSADPGSVDNCGEYTFGKGVMVKEFEDASFDMSIGEYRIVKTNFGFHLIKKVSEVPAGTLGLDDEIVELPGTTVRQVVQKILTDEKAKSIFDAYVDSLKENANISYEVEI